MNFSIDIYHSNPAPFSGASFYIMDALVPAFVVFLRGNIAHISSLIGNSQVVTAVVLLIPVLVVTQFILSKRAAYLSFKYQTVKEGFLSGFFRSDIAVGVTIVIAIPIYLNKIGVNIINNKQSPISHLTFNHFYSQNKRPRNGLLAELAKVKADKNHFEAQKIVSNYRILASGVRYPTLASHP